MVIDTMCLHAHQITTRASIIIIIDHSLLDSQGENEHVHKKSVPRNGMEYLRGGGVSPMIVF